MGLMSSLYSGASGIEANTQDLNVIGDNIANGNTIGFKSSRAVFADALANSLLGGGGQIGQGVHVAAVQKILTQGSLLSTGVATDLAIQGKGFLIVHGNHNGQVADYYTRAGQLTVDKDGYLTNIEGMRVQGYNADQTGSVAGSISDLQPGEQTSPPKATDRVTMAINLDSEAEVLDNKAPPVPWDPKDPARTSNFSTTTTVYDDLGNAHSVDIYFRKTAAGAWEWHALIAKADVDGPAAAATDPEPFKELGTGTMTFDLASTPDADVGTTARADLKTAGTINGYNEEALTANGLTIDTDGTTLVIAQNLTTTLANGSSLNFRFALGDKDKIGVTQFASDSTTNFMSQDGYPTGSLTGLQFDESGHIVGNFSNGQSRNIGQLALAEFAANDQLDRIGSSLYAASYKAGERRDGRPAEGGFGAIAPGNLEQSTVDISQEFIRMMSAQRGFQANSKTITTADQLLSELIQLKRT
ncbi:MAG: hypothetical protein RL199_1148 [Pseudomonadota bacterium]|jgi:flagellar hook protein FlgE